MSEQRAYHSPLRARQTQATREQILQALIDLINDQGAQDLNIKELAATAGVAERTVYRHFPDRTALLDGLVEYLAEKQDWPRPRDMADATELAAVITGNWTQYDVDERETRALVLMNQDPARVATRSQEHAGEILDLVRTSFPQLSEQDTLGVAAVFGLLVSSRSWLRIVDGYGLSGAESSRYVGWTLNLMVDALTSGTAEFPPIEPWTPTT